MRISKTNSNLDKVFSANASAGNLIAYLPLSARQDIHNSFSAIFSNPAYIEKGTTVDRFFDVICMQHLTVHSFVNSRFGVSLEDAQDYINDNDVLKFLNSQQMNTHYTRKGEKLVALNLAGRSELLRLVARLYDMLCNCYARQEALI